MEDPHKKGNNKSYSKRESKTTQKANKACENEETGCLPAQWPIHHVVIQYSMNNLKQIHIYDSKSHK